MLLIVTALVMFSREEVPLETTSLVVIALLTVGLVAATGDSGGRELFYAWIALYRALFPGA